MLALILLEKLKIVPDEIEKREVIAQRYSNALRQSNRIRVPHILDGAKSSWAQYTIQVPDRDRLQAALKAEGIPTAVYYPIPLSRQRGYQNYLSAPTPVSQALSKSVLSLPMHPYLDEQSQQKIVDAVMSNLSRA